jgi:hypothetical protein
MLTQCPQRSELLVFGGQLEDMSTASSTTHFSKASGLKHWNEAHDPIHPARAPKNAPMKNEDAA